MSRGAPDGAASLRREECDVQQCRFRPGRLFLPDAGRAPSARSARVGKGFVAHARRSEEHTSELQSLMRISYAVFCLKKKLKTKANVGCHVIRHNTIS